MRPYAGVVVTCLIVLSGCSTASVGGSPMPGTPSGSGNSTSAAAAATTFDSCGSLSDADVQSLGLRPNSKKNSDVANGDLGTGCNWSNDDVEASLLSTPKSVSDFENDTGFINVKPTTIDGRQSVSFQLDGTGNCVVALPVQRGTVVVSLGLQFSSIGKVDPCSIATDIATKLAPLLPK